MTRVTRRVVPLLLVAAGAGALVAPQSAGAAPRPADPVAAIERAAHPLRSTAPGGSSADLRALGRMVGGASVVGLGEATHGSHEFFTMKERVFRHLVKEKGFTTFTQEMSWTTGLRLDAYVRGGKGDVRELVHRELAKTPWDTEEYVHLLTWMRAYNDKHPARELRFMGNDLNYPEQGVELFDGVRDYVRAHEPDLRPAIDDSYAPLRRLTDGDTYMGLPLAERKALTKKAWAAYDLLKERRPAGGAKAYELALHHALSVAQTADMYAFPLDTADGQRDAMLYRDRIMAENTAWWQRYHGGKVLLSAHNAHVAYESYDPRYPKMQGAFLRDSIGKRYASIGFTFDRGGFMAQGPDSEVWKPRSVGPATRGMNEHTLDKVRHDDYFVDLRTLPAPTRKWLSMARTTRSIGSGWPDGPYKIRLAPSHDILIHLHEVTAAHRQSQ
ncbi:erythromycin esterase family protein [Streptomyces kanamyceticus]|uniref:Erythromycin esterase family protein n=1 Tax=Streptomyces kanamyceticus TaxID=1967 RepID=A0A5J6GN62_STRKN|nr:erythromycin esterase family protein [Streptomyces kanamyceticus]QEU95425.1 erythromycin esterase family protein [Streptomyces kanamyceticus]